MNRKYAKYYSNHHVGNVGKWYLHSITNSGKNPMTPTWYYTSDQTSGFSGTQYTVVASTTATNFPMTGVGMGIGNYLTWIDQDAWRDTTHAGEHLYTALSGLKIHIRRDGGYTITAPDNVKLEELIRLQPNARLLDQYGRVIQIEPNGVIGVQALKNATTRFIDIADPTAVLKDSLAFTNFNRIAIPETGCRLLLPNDVELNVDETGLIKIIDADQKVFYEAAPRLFNKFLNASDVLESFIRYLGTQQVRQRHVMKMPLGLFINWLVIEAAHADGDPADDLQPKLVDGITTIKAQPRCLYCRRFIAQARYDRGINFCQSQHMDRYMAREDLVRLPKPHRARSRLALPPSATYFDRAA
jgi:hypothetical protein